MREILFDFELIRWQAILLSSFPALLNFSIFIYIITRYRNNAVIKVFSLFVLSLTFWQVCDTFLRMSRLPDAAILWNNIFSPAWLLTAPLGFHFSILLRGRKKYSESFLLQLLLYFPSVVFVIINFITPTDVRVYKSDFWGFVFSFDPWSHWAIEGYWLSALALVTLVVLLYNYRSLPQMSRKRDQARIIAAGYAIPVLTGVTFEVILPAFTSHFSMPLTSTFLTFFAITAIIAFKKYNLFSIEESIKLRAILDTVPDIMIVLSPEGKVRFINKEGAIFLGTNPLKCFNCDLRNFFPEENGYQKFMIDVFNRVHGGEKIINYQSRIVCSCRKKIPVLISATVLDTAPGHRQVLIMIRDISLLMKTKHQLTMAGKQLKESKDELNTFFYHATHDLKGPVSSMLGLIAVAKQTSGEGALAPYFELFEQSAHRLDAIISSLVRFIHYIEKQPEVTLLDLDDLVHKSIKDTMNNVNSGEVDFIVRIDTKFQFYSDRDLLSSVLHALIDNAIRYRRNLLEKKSFVKIKITDLHNRVKIIIRDNGTGIRKDLQKRVFSIFFRGTETSSGDGLSLFAVKHIVNKLNGTIRLESREKSGTTFIIYLPNHQPVKQELMAE